MHVTIVDLLNKTGVAKTTVFSYFHTISKYVTAKLMGEGINGKRAIS